MRSCNAFSKRHPQRIVFTLAQAEQPPACICFCSRMAESGEEISAGTTFLVGWLAGMITALVLVLVTYCAICCHRPFTSNKHAEIQDDETLSFLALSFFLSLFRRGTKNIFLVAPLPTRVKKSEIFASTGPMRSLKFAGSMIRKKFGVKFASASLMRR